MKSHIRKDELSLHQQMYLEAITELEEKHGHAHASEIARLLKVKKPSVTEAVRRLIHLKVVRKSGPEVTLTKRGQAIASELAHRHETLRRFMVDVLDMNAQVADEAACRVEHAADAEFVKRLLLLDEFFQSRESASIKKRWRSYLRKG